MDDIELSFDKDVFEFVVQRSIEFKLGARGLRSILEAILTDAMFELPSKKNSKKFNVTLDYAQNKFHTSSISKLKVA